MTSCDAKPNIRSAATLNSSMRPRPSITRMASTAESMIDRYRSSLERSAASTRLVSVMSRPMADAPTTRPSASKIGETVSEMGT